MARKVSRPKGAKQVESIRHKDSRPNIPTRELRDFVRDDEVAPKTMLYPRDPSLDPQLVWKGKDEQDLKPLEVPIVPIHIQEKIHPHAIIEDVRAASKRTEPQLDLFGDFNGIEEFDKRVDFYHHEAHWSNRMILGDSLLVMTSLAEKEGLKGKVQCIYFDPPYGIRFGSNWQVSTRRRDVKDGKVDDATRQPEQVKAFRDTWERGIHSYLSYLRNRFVAARELLTDSGSIFVQIGDQNVHLVRDVLDEVFGSDNFVALVTFKKTTGAGSFAGGTNVLASVADYILWYGREKSAVKYRQLYRGKSIAGEGADQYDWIEFPDGTRRPTKNGEMLSPPDRARLFSQNPLTSQTVREAQTTVFPVEFEGSTYFPSTGGWKTNRQGMDRLHTARRLIAIGKNLRYVRYIGDFPAFPYNNVWEDTVTSGFGDPKTYVVQTNRKIVERCVLMTTDPGDLVLDPTCGSGTTAYVAEQWGRRWITIDTSRVALTLARTRLMSAKFPYYLLADSPEGVRQEAEITGRVPPDHRTDGDIRKGFVYKRVPHVTLKSIANNPDIRDRMSREEIDRAIAKHAELETLYDQPYEDPGRLRVTGPLTVESLSPHRVLSTEAPAAETVADGGRSTAAGSFAEVIIENLRKAGVQNTKKNERLKFDRLDPHPGQWVHAVGEYTEGGGKPKRVAVTIGPEHGTLGPQQIKAAAKEAVQGLGHDLLIACAFAFDPHVAEEAKRYGKLQVLVTRMNPDLVMGEDLLKKTGAGNLFMVFGEPDVEIRKEKDGKLVLEVKGVDVYDPTTGQFRSSSTDDIACWFIDTDYNEESFFVRHAYFTGEGEPYEKLKRALRAEIDEAAWSSLYSTVSRPFPKPSTGKIAVKVINHYGDEVLKVFDV